ncbi:MAG: hypothetical protein R2991_10985 [Thermoanaerobaculia bacterium]
MRSTIRSPHRSAAILMAGLASWSLPGAAQWSSDPAANLVLADRTGEQVQPKVVPTADGGAYVSWFDNATGGYDVTLQRLDVQGFEQWAHDGVLVADRSFSSTQDYGLAVDTGGNALLAYRDDSGPNDQIAAAKVDPDGTLLWGAGGIQVSATTGFVAAPKIAGTSDGNVVVAWTQDSSVMVQRLDPDGAPLWSPAVEIAPSSGSFSLSDLHAAPGGDVVLSFVHQVSTTRHLWAQKLDADGDPLWGAGHVQVYDGAGSLQFGNFPSFVPDGSGGAVFSWYITSPLQVFAQRLLANGTEAFAHNGVAGSTDGVRLRASPTVAFDPATQEAFLFWVETDSLQSQFGVWGQKLDAAGARQWTDSGRTLVPLGASQPSFVQAATLGDGAVAAWIDGIAFGNAPIRASRRDGAGDAVWDPDPVALKTSATGSSRLAGATSSAGFGIYVWSDGTSDGDILAQNLNPDGSLGPAFLFTDGFESGDTSAWTTAVP